MQRHGRNHPISLRPVCGQESTNPHHHQPLRLRNRKRLRQPRPLQNARHAQPHRLRQRHPRQTIVIARNEATKKLDQKINHLSFFLLLFQSKSFTPKFKMNYTISPPNTPSHLLSKLQLPLTVTNCPGNRIIIPDKLPFFPKTK